jgi:hypothetical protein
MSGADSDTDGADHRDCQTAWDNDEPQTPDDRTEDNAWNNRTVLGVVIFERPESVCSGYFWHNTPEELNSCDPCEINPITCFHNSTDEITGNNKITIFPNPVKDFLTIDNIQDVRTIMILKPNGQLLLSERIMDKKVDLSRLPNGIYIAKIGENVFKLIKE